MDLVSTSVQTSNRILGICKAYIKGVKDAPADLRHILIEVGSLKCVLEVLQLSAEASDGALLRHLNGPNGPLERCRETLVDLEAILVTNGGPSSGNENEAGAGSFDGKASSFFKKGKTGSTQDAHVGSSGVSYQDLQWPFKRTLALRLLAELTTYKQTISLGLTTETWQDVKQLKQKVDHLQVMTEGAEMNQILTWLVTIDPSPLHNSACDLHEPHTGQWLIRSPDYTRWKQLQATFIWLHGIPGAGKTVLLSYIAEDVRAFCGDKTNVGYGWAYYYCSFTHNGEESPHFLRWIINQLCRQIGRFPLELQKLFRRGEQPSVLVLFQALMAVTRCFERVYIVVDAVDESQEREKLIELLLKLAREPSLGRLQLLVMSRKERNIAEAFLSESTDISLSNPYVDEDIKTFVHGQLETDSKLSRWNLTLRDEIEEALVKGAQGMFRWVFCQLDILKRLNLATAIRQAIAKLPKTLDDTYERVLCSIPEEQCGNCHKALQLLAEGGSAIDTLWHINISAEMDFDNLKILEIDEPTRDVARRSSVAFRAINVSSDRFRRAARLSDGQAFSLHCQGVSCF